jgi:endonuclease/exonuclease/phosphatase (EEP) superfamily protein YafD
MTRAIDLFLRAAALLLCAAIIGGLASLLGLIESANLTLARAGWVLDTLVQFQIPYAAAILALAPLLALRRLWRSLAALALCAASVGVMLWPYAPTFARATQARAHTLTIVSVNLWKDQVDPDRLRRFLRAVDADVVVVTEASARWRLLLAEDFPHRIAIQSEGLFLLSRRAIAPPSLSDLPESALAGRICFAGPSGPRCATIIGLHTPSPISRQRTLERDHELRQTAAAIARHRSDPVILAGDFNTSPWSRGFRALLARSGLSDSTWNGALLPTWSRRWYVPTVPIDHILHSADLRVVQRSTGPDLGSDHLPVVARLAFR